MKPNRLKTLSLLAIIVPALTFACSEPGVDNGAVFVFCHEEMFRLHADIEDVTFLSRIGQQAFQIRPRAERV